MNPRWQVVLPIAPSCVLIGRLRCHDLGVGRYGSHDLNVPAIFSHVKVNAKPLSSDTRVFLRGKRWSYTMPLISYYSSLRIMRRASEVLRCGLVLPASGRHEKVLKNRYNVGTPLHTRSLHE